MGNPHPSIPNKQITRQYFPARELSNNKELKTYMITYKRIRGDDKSLALYYTEADFSVRYEIDINLYGKLPRLTWSSIQQSLITSRNCSLSRYISNNGQSLGRDKYVITKDGNMYNLRHSNLKILSKNEYIIDSESENITFLHINSPISNKCAIAIVDTKYVKYLSKYCWRLSKGYIVAKQKNSLSTIYLHQLIIDLVAGRNFELIIDHIDGNKLNNIETNLRQVTYTENSRNCKYKNKLPGTILGVFTADGAWYAHSPCPINKGKLRRKSFSIKLYGEDKAKQLAIQQRQIWEKELGITSVIIT